MDTLKTTKRMSFTRVGLLSFAMLFVWSVGSASQFGAGLRYEDVGILSFFVIPAFVICGIALLIWQGIIWAIFGKSRPWRGRTWLALMPSVIVLGMGIDALIFNPASPQKQFHRAFHASLPTDVRNLQVAPRSLTDLGGDLDYAFECPKDATLALIKELKWKPIGNEKDIRIYGSRIVREWSIRDWKNARQFVKFEPVKDRVFAGYGFFLITDASMERTFIRRCFLFPEEDWSHWEQ